MMSDDILSQDEIDALLGASSSEPGSEEETEAFDLRPVGGTVEAAMGKTATALGIMMQAEGKAAVKELAIAPLRELHQTLQGPLVAVEGTLQGALDGMIITLMSLETAVKLAALARGEDPASAGGEDLGGLHDLAVEMAGHLAEAFSSQLGQELHLDAAEPVQVNWDSAEAPPVPVGADEEVVFARHTLEVGSVSFDVMHIIPRETAEAVVSALAGGVSGAAEAAAAGEAALAAASAGRTVPRVAGGKVKGRTNGGAQIAAAEFAPLGSAHPAGTMGNIDLLLDVPLEVTVELGRTRMQIREVLELGRGSIVELEKVAGEPVEIYVNGKLIAKGEVVTIDENFGVKITDIVSRRERVASFS